VFGCISLEAKSKILLTVPGNHDYWVMGTPLLGRKKDQCGNGYLQFYAQDAKASENVTAGNKAVPYDFSVNPGDLSTNSLSALWGCKLPTAHNFWWYNQIGNVGLIGQSGAYSLDDTKPFMAEACEWVAQQSGLQLVVLFGHWDVDGLGADSEMAMPKWYTEMATYPGCKEFNERGMLKFIMGHTHCNSPHPRGEVGVGFRVAGFGMASSCANYAFRLWTRPRRGCAFGISTPRRTHCTAPCSIACRRAAGASAQIWQFCGSTSRSTAHH